MSDKMIEYFLVVVVTLIVLGIAFESLLCEEVRRDNFPRISQRCYKISFMDALVCKIK